MRALLLSEPGNFDGLHVGDLPRPVPGPGEVLVRVRAAGLNPVDDKVAGGSGEDGWTWPHVLGEDAAGVVEEVGPGVEGLAVGDRVACHGDLRRQGCFAEYVVERAWTVAHVPDGVTDVAAAALPCAGMTAYQAIARRLRVGAGQTVLVTAGAGGVGGFAVQLARMAGARVLSSASGVNAGWVRRLGAEPIDYTATDVATTVREMTDGRGVDGVLDTLGVASATENIGLLAYAGGIATIDGRPDLSAVPEFTTAVSVHEVALGAVYQWGDRAAQGLLATDLGTLLGLVEEGRLDPMVTRVTDLEGIPDSLRELRGRHVRGKIVAEV
jgi:NADPH:quinone reductase-like Zn-dependent oxidoreductase